MEIHELNTFSGTPGAGDYLATDNGSDTSKISAESLLAPLNARIDNIIAGGDAPSAAEVTDARLGSADLGGILYASVGDAVRGQDDELYNTIKQLQSAVFSGVDNTTFNTSGTYTNGGVVFQSLSLKKNHRYMFEINSSYAGNSNGYIYFFENGTQRKSFPISKDKKFNVIEYVPPADYVFNAILGWNTTGVKGIITFYEKAMTMEDISSALIEDGEAWIDE